MMLHDATTNTSDSLSDCEIQIFTHQTINRLEQTHENISLYLFQLSLQDKLKSKFL